MIAAFALLSISCSDDVPDPSGGMTRADDEVASVAEGGSAGPSGPAFGPVFYYATPDIGGGHFSSVTLLGSADGGKYGLLALTVYCDDGELKISTYLLPETSLDPVTVNLGLDGDAPLQQAWKVSRAYAATLGYDATATKPALLFADLAEASVAVLDIPQLNLGPAAFELAALFSTPVQTYIEHCGDDEPTEVIEPPSDYQPITAAEGTVSDNVSYRVEILRGDRLYTTVSFEDPNVFTASGRVKLVLACKPDGNLNVELANLPRPADTGEVPPQATEVVLRFDHQPPQVEQWPLYSLSDSVEAHAEAPWPLMQAMVRAASLLISLPDFGIEAIVVELPDLFSTPVQDNLSHCGYYEVVSQA